MSSMANDTDDFYEDDEPVQELIEVYRTGPHVVTEAPPVGCQVVSAANMLSYGAEARYTATQDRSTALVQG